jgi:hypothetical protein
MIYLIDDNQANQQIEKFGIRFIESNEFSEFLISKERLDINTDLSFLQTATCILLHSSTEDVVDGNFVSGSISNTTKIIKEICDNGDTIPLVLFSEQMSEIAIIPNNHYLRAIKKSTFYSNLFSFLSYFKENNLLEFKILAYGKNFKSIEITECVRLINEKLIFKNQEEVIKLKDINLRVFKELIEMSSIQYTFDDLIENLEDHPISIKKFIENLSYINQSFTKYGKNIYSWL